MKVFGLLASYLPLREEWSRIVASYGLVPEPDGVNATWHEVEFCKRQQPSPTKEDILQAIIADIDACTDEKILNGYQWTVLHGDHAGQTVSVWLSAENQNNFKAKHDAALAYPQQVPFPMRYKIGQDEQKHAIYEEFQNIGELATFYLGGVAYIERCVDEGWQIKDEVLSRGEEYRKEEQP